MRIAFILSCSILILLPIMLLIAFFHLVNANKDEMNEAKFMFLSMLCFGFIVPVLMFIIF